MPSNPQQVRTQARFEALIGLAVPALDLVLNVGDRISRIIAPEDDYVPVRAPADRIELGSGQRASGSDS